MVLSRKDLLHQGRGVGGNQNILVHQLPLIRLHLRPPLQSSNVAQFQWNDSLEETDCCHLEQSPLLVAVEEKCYCLQTRQEHLLIVNFPSYFSNLAATQLLGYQMWQIQKYP